MAGRHLLHVQTSQLQSTDGFKFNIFGLNRWKTDNRYFPGCGFRTSSSASLIAYISAWNCSPSGHNNKGHQFFPYQIKRNTDTEIILQVTICPIRRTMMDFSVVSFEEFNFMNVQNFEAFKNNLKILVCPFFARCAQLTMPLFCYMANP